MRYFRTQIRFCNKAVDNFEPEGKQAVYGTSFVLINDYVLHNLIVKHILI